MKSILIVSSRIPHAGGKADSMTVFRIIEYFGKRGWNVFLASFVTSDGELRHVEALERICAEVKVVRMNKWKAVGGVVGNLLNTSVPMQVSFFRDNRMQRLVDELLEKHQPDLAYAHLIRTAEYLKRNRDFAGPRALAMPPPFHPSAPVQRRLQRPRAKSKFLAVKKDLGKADWESTLSCHENRA